MKPLSGVDGAFLHLETPQTPMHVASLHLFDLPAGADAGDFHADILRQLRRRLRIAPVLARRLAPMPLQFANPAWVHESEVDLEYHVQKLTLPRPGTQAQLEACAADLHSQLLDRSRPLWRMAVIDGLPGRRAAMYMKVHHAMLDGQAGVMLAQALFDLTPRPRAVPRGVAAQAERPGAAELAAAALRHDAGQYIKFVRHLPDVVKTLAGLVGLRGARGAGTAVDARATAARSFPFGPRTPLNVPITGERTFAAVTLPLDALVHLAACHEAKLNDIVLALCSGALRRYLSRHGGIPSRPLIATMPISLREAAGAGPARTARSDEPGESTEFTTQATLSLVNLGTTIADPVKRLRAIRDAAGATKALARQARGVIPTDFPSIGVPWLLHGLASLYGRSGLAGVVPPIANVVISNVSGPRVPLYAAGARMTDYWPLSIVEHGLGLNITVMSYAGTMGFGFTAARSAVPDARRLVDALQEALDELVARSRPPARTRRPRARAAAQA